MRTPNCKCQICGKELYRRPSDLKRFSGVCCRGCRSAYLKQFPPSPNLELGREKGTNHLTGIAKSKESNAKRSVSHKLWCKNNPDKVKDRSKKTRGEKHYLWKGGATKLNISIRQLDENRKWMDAVKARDGGCVNCGAIAKLESHHIIPFAMLLERYTITDRETARNTPQLWDVSNGITLCRKCHYELHGRKYNDND